MAIRTIFRPTSVSGAYASALPAHRDSVEAVVRASLQGLAHRRAVVATARGLYRQRMFAGVLPSGFIVRKVAQMFRPPEDAGTRAAEKP